jgi:hypothetical protein
MIMILDDIRNVTFKKETPIDFPPPMIEDGSPDSVFIHNGFEISSFHPS